MYWFGIIFGISGLIVAVFAATARDDWRNGAAFLGMGMVLAIFGVIGIKSLKRRRAELEFAEAAYERMLARNR